VSRPALALALALALPAPAALGDGRPNVLLIVSDDQGFGDLGRHGNPVLRTPHLDRLASEGIEIAQFYASPVCAPTRASLMTGRYNYRTRVVDTYLGRALMDPDEVTLPQVLKAAGYRTGIFGKWHLGDNFPMRPQDRGFDEALVIRGGGIAQPSDPPGPGGSGYDDPVLQHDGREERARGYCSDVFSEAALRFIEADRDRPFFAYLAFNAPHTPLQVPAYYEHMYEGPGLSPDAFPNVGRPIEGRVDPVAVARTYGMVTNLDDNVGRVLARLEALGLAGDTIVAFLSDNGPQEPRYNAGLRGRKGTVYEGGIRVPCFLRWPGHFEAGRTLDAVAAHIDLMPTLLDACGVAPPEGVALDGRSLLPLLTGRAASLPERALFFQWHRGDAPEPLRAFAAREGRWKLVQPEGVGEGAKVEDPHLALYDIEADPFEERDVSAAHPEVVARLREAYLAWFRDVSATRGYDPPRIAVGSDAEPRVVLTRQDWRGPRAGWKPGSLGHWEVDVRDPGPYRVTVRFAPPEGGGATLRLRVGAEALEATVAGAGEHTFEAVRLAPGPAEVAAALTPSGGGEPFGALYVELERSGPAGSPR
jgi:arylsulfatase/arylsulfatase A